MHHGDCGGGWASGSVGGAGGHFKQVHSAKGYGMRHLPVHFHLSALTWVIVQWLHAGMRQL